MCIQKLPLHTKIWMKICRIHRKGGFGIQSPFAFNLVTGVIYEDGEYYAYESLSDLSKQNNASWREKDDRLMMRLANDHQPRNCLLWGDDSSLVREYIKTGKAECKQVVILDNKKEAFLDYANKYAGNFDLIYVSSPQWVEVFCEILSLCGSSTLLVVRNINSSRAVHRKWNALINDKRCRVSFDLPTMGLVYFYPKLNKRDYVIDF